MSDVSKGPGWWVAGDGRWYPPETHPDYGRTAAGAGTPGADPDAAPAPQAGAGAVAAPPANMPPPFVDGTQLLGVKTTAPGASRRAATDTVGASAYGGSAVGAGQVEVHNLSGVSSIGIGLAVLILAIGGFIAYEVIHKPNPHRSADAIAAAYVGNFYAGNQKAANADLLPGQNLTVWTEGNPPAASVQFLENTPDADGVDTDVHVIVCFNLSGSPCNAKVTGSAAFTVPVVERNKLWYVDSSAITECGPGNLVCFNPYA